MYWSHKSFPGLEGLTKLERAKLILEFRSRYSRIIWLHTIGLLFSIVVVIPLIYIQLPQVLLSEVIALLSGLITYQIIYLFLLNKIEYPLYIKHSKNA